MRARGSGPGLPRDRAVLIRLARHRVLSLAQVQQLVFPGLHRSRVSRRVGALEREGWVSTWEQPVNRGGRPRLVLPTTQGLRWALGRLEAETAIYPYARLVGTMLRRDGRRPLPFQRGVAPPFLAHMHEVNDVLISLCADPALAVTWVSSWNRPLPNTSHGLPLPQPDGVVVVSPGDGAAELVFLEHDRGGESLVHFRSRKIDRYRQLAKRPGLLADLTGFHAFRVWVTVRAGEAAATAERIAELGRCAKARLAGPLFAFAAFDPDRPVARDLLGVNAAGLSRCDGVSSTDDGVLQPPDRGDVTTRHDQPRSARAVGLAGFHSERPVDRVDLHIPALTSSGPASGRGPSLAADAALLTGPA